MNKAWISVIGALLVLATAGTALGAPVANAGVSGQCYDGSGHGGNGTANATVNDDGSLVLTPTSGQLQDPGFDQAWATSVAKALAQFGGGLRNNSGDTSKDACPNPNDSVQGSGDNAYVDYLEVHGSAAGQTLQVCYNHEGGDFGHDSGLHVYQSYQHADCPTSAPGPNPSDSS